MRNSSKTASRRSWKRSPMSSRKQRRVRPTMFLPRESRASKAQTASMFSRKFRRKSSSGAAVLWPRPFVYATRNIVISSRGNLASYADAPRQTRIISALPSPGR
jgi:hypothetical protein